MILTDATAHGASKWIRRGREVRLWRVRVMAGRRIVQPQCTPRGAAPRIVAASPQRRSTKVNKEVERRAPTIGTEVAKTGPSRIPP